MSDKPTLSLKEKLKKTDAEISNSIKDPKKKASFDLYSIMHDFSNDTGTLIEAIKIRAKLGADLNQTTIVGNTFLHHYAKLRNLEVVRTLLNYGADGSIRSNSSENALGYVFQDEELAYKPWKEGITLLLKAGIDPNDTAPRRYYYSALNNAALGHSESVKLLLAAGGDIKSLDADDNTPLEAVDTCLNGHIQKLLSGLYNDTERAKLRSEVTHLHTNKVAFQAAQFIDSIIGWYKDPTQLPIAMPKDFSLEHHELLKARMKSIFQKEGIPERFFEMSVNTPTSAINMEKNGVAIIPEEIKTTIIKEFVPEVRKSLSKSPENIENILATILPSLINKAHSISIPNEIYKERINDKGKKLSPEEYLENIAAEIKELERKGDKDSKIEISQYKAQSLMLLHDSSQWEENASRQQLAYRHYTGASETEAAAHNLTLEGLFNAFVTGKDLPKIPHSESTTSLISLKEVCEVKPKDIELEHPYISDENWMELNSVLERARSGYYASEIKENLQSLFNVISPIAHVKEADYDKTHIPTTESEIAHAGAGTGSHAYDISDHGAPSVESGGSSAAHSASSSSSHEVADDSMGIAHGGAGSASHHDDGDRELLARYKEWLGGESVGAKYAGGHTSAEKAAMAARSRLSSSPAKSTSVAHNSASNPTTPDTRNSSSNSAVHRPKSPGIISGR